MIDRFVPPRWRSHRCGQLIGSRSGHGVPIIAWPLLPSYDRFYDSAGLT